MTQRNSWIVSVVALFLFVGVATIIFVESRQGHPAVLVTTPEATVVVRTVTPTATPTPVLVQKTPASSPTPVPTSMPSPTVVPTLTPTSTPRPTSAPTLTPTVTPRPTSAPTSTSTPLPTLTPSAMDRLGPVDPLGLLPRACGDSANVTEDYGMPLSLGNQEGVGRIRVRYVMPPGATDATFDFLPMIVEVRGSGSFANTVSGSDILAVFPEARVDPDKIYILPPIRISVPKEATSLIVDGQPHVIEWTFSLPTESEYDILETDGWQWSKFFTLPFVPLGAPKAVISYALDGVRWWGIELCSNRPVIGK